MRNGIKQDILEKMFAPDNLDFTKVTDKHNIKDIMPIVESLENESFDVYTNIHSFNFGVNGISPLLDGKPMTQWAFTQMCSSLGVPSMYMEKLLSQDDNGADLYMEQLKYWQGKYQGARDDMNTLLRFTKDTLCGVLSGGYNPYDDSQLFAAVEDATKDLELTVSNMTISPSITKVRLVNKERLTFGDSEELSWGLDISNSRVGRASVKANFILFRWACTNGMTFGKRTAHLFRKTHRGVVNEADIKGLIARSGDFVQFVKASFDNGINTEMTSETLESLLNTYKRIFSDAAAGKVLSLYNTKYNTGNLWGVTNAMTEVAQGYNVITRTDMEDYAGELLARKVA